MRGVVALGLLGLVPVAAQEPGVRLVAAISGIASPTDIQHAADGSGRLFVAQQDGRIRILKDGALLPGDFLDLRPKTKGQGESGLLGLAFPPEFHKKQHFYVNYTNLDGHTVVARYRVSQDPNLADWASEQILLTVLQPYENHNGGCIRFGPDGHLYVATGDGGSGGDPHDHGQNLKSLLGKMLRLDVESDLAKAAPPTDNPFAGNEAWAPEVWALGLRNPWRFSFDRETGDLWMGDVGQERREEVNFQPRASRGGENYGWNRREGTACYFGECNEQGLTPPVVDYDHDQGCSVIGGHVYRGNRERALQGTYLYGDLCSGYLWGIRREDDRWVNRLLLKTGFNISTFGEDESGEVYVADYNGGTIYRILAPAEPEPPPAPVGGPSGIVLPVAPGR